MFPSSALSKLPGRRSTFRTAASSKLLVLFLIMLALAFFQLIDEFHHPPHTVHILREQLARITRVHSGFVFRCRGVC